ncbi:MAG: tRNA (adenine-N1)-methyltransferase [Candidatus Aenigmatarchaeota archaeon]
MFAEGDTIIFIDMKDRRYMQKLKKGGVFHFSGGYVEHDAVIGKQEGSVVKSSLGVRLIVFRPTLSDYILEMPRGAQIIYPKDLGIILMWADIFPGARVLESGIGSGALTMSILRVVGEKGCVISYEIREDFIARALRNIEAFMGKPGNLVVKKKDIYEGIEESDIDRIILDLPEPWRVVDEAAKALKPGGIILTYSPTIIQSQRTCIELKKSEKFTMICTFEVLMRNWHITEQSVRPDHRMVAHTGFITTARRLFV